MGLEDDGTPPADGQGLLGDKVQPSTYLVPAARRLPAWGSSRHTRSRLLSKHSAARQEVKANFRFKGAANSLDLVRLLEENWFWRSSTASPSMSVPTSASTSSSDSDQRLHRTESDADPGALSERANQNLDTAAHSQRRGSAESTQPSLERQEDFADARRSVSANIDDAFATEQHGEQAQAHSYAQGTNFNLRNPGGVARPDPTLGDPLGTWAQRVFRFAPGGQKTSAPTHIPGTPEVAEMRSRAKLQGKAGMIPEEHEDDEAAVEAAWRWRFNRRWRTEQAKQLDPEFGLDGDDEDGWDTALGYLDACGPGYHLQMARTTSLEKNLASSSLVSDSSDYGNFLMDDSQREKSALKEQAEMDATKSIVSVAKKAQNLYQQQQKIERDVQTRWGNAKVSMAWAGQHIAAVSIDTYGKFSFILAKVSDRTTAHRLLVRGRNGSDKNALMRALTLEVQETCKQHNFAGVSVALLGSGKMEWSRERDHRINITSGRLEKGSDPAIQKNDDVTRLAGALTRASLHAPNRVTVNGEKLS